MHAADRWDVHTDEAARAATATRMQCRDRSHEMMLEGLEKLHAFARLAEGGSFTRVAEELGVSQSTVSRWLADLEEQVGAQLLERSTRTLRRTFAGERFYDRVVRILADADDAVSDVAALAGRLAGPVVVSIPVELGRDHAIDALLSFRCKHPSVELRVIVTDSYVSLLEDGVDLAVRLGSLPDSSLTVRTVTHIPRRLVASACYLEARSRPLAPEDLADHDCLVHTATAQRTSWSFQRGACRAANGQTVPAVDGSGGNDERSHATVFVRGPLAVTNSAMTRDLAVQGHGVALLGAWLVEDDLRAGRLVELLPEWRAPDAPLSLLSPPGRRPPLRVRRLAEHLAGALRPLGENFRPGDAT